jgi:hypothetical protein
MATGHRFVNFTQKRIISVQDLGERFLGYLQELNRESVRARYDFGGVFNIKLGLSGAIDTLRIDGSSRATDGQGHLFDPDVIEREARFENTAGVEYFVGLRYAERPDGIGINPRTGRPEYLYHEETVGEQGRPDFVTDNGDGTITMAIDSLCESGVSSAGRRALVYMVIPAEGAIDDSIAFEEVEVAFSGGINRLTTTSALGQSVISLDAADYMVLVIGPTVRRNVSLDASDQHAFIGKVTGAGLGNPPATFETSGQVLLTTFTSAHLIQLTPYGWINVTTVQKAFERVVDALADSAGAEKVGFAGNGWIAAGTVANSLAGVVSGLAGAQGASRVGFDPYEYVTGTNVQAAVETLLDFLDGPSGASRVGVGTMSVQQALAELQTDPNFWDADGIGTLPAGSLLQEVFNAIDLRLQERRAWTAIYAGTGATRPGDVNQNNLDPATALPGVYFLRAADKYELGFPGTAGSEFHCEGAGQPIEIQNTTRLGGKWSRAVFQVRGGSNVDIGNDACWLQEFSIERGSVVFEPGNASGPVVDWRRGMVGPRVDDADRAHDHGVRFSGGNQSGHLQALFEDILFVGAAAPGGDVLRIETDFAQASGPAEERAPIVFRRCTFTAYDVNSRCAYIGSWYPVVFEDCLFVTPPGSQVYACEFVGADVTMRGCRIQAGGNAGVFYNFTRGGVYGSRIACGTPTNGSLTTGALQALQVQSTTVLETFVSDVQVILYNDGIGLTQAFAVTLTGCEVANLDVSCRETRMPTSGTLVLGACHATNVRLDLTSVSEFDNLLASGNACFIVNGSVSGMRVLGFRNLPNGFGHRDQWWTVTAYESMISNLELSVDPVQNSDSKWGGVLHLLDDCVMNSSRVLVKTTTNELSADNVVRIFGRGVVFNGNYVEADPPDNQSATLSNVILTDSSTSRCVVSNNSVVLDKVDAGIAINMKADYSVCDGNTIRASSIASSGIHVDTGARGVLVRGNYCEFSSPFGITMNGSNGTCEGNVVRDKTGGGTHISVVGGNVINVHNQEI